MRGQLQAQRRAVLPTAIAIGAFLLFSTCASASEPELNALGQSGGLVIPYGFVLPEGVLQAQYGNYIDPRYGKKATSSDIYWGAVGLLPYVEVSGGLVNYPGNVTAPFSGADHMVLRHLMANVKVEVPRFFKYQPSIAFGVSDIGGQTHYFRSKYGVVSQSLGPATLTLGYGTGDRLDGVFGGASVALWNTGISLIAEDDSKTPYAGVRYASPAIRWLADASVVGTVMRSVRSTNGVAPRTSVSVAISIPLGKRFDAQRCGTGLCESASPAQPLDSAASIPDAHADTPAPLTLQSPLSPLAMPASYATPADAPANSRAEMRKAVAQDSGAALDLIAEQLFAAGLERVRVGIDGDALIVEYENHRYNQNEADALGIVLGVASIEAPDGIRRVHAIIKKANEPLADVSVERDAYAQFVRGGSPQAASATLAMSTQPDSTSHTVDWHGDASRHGLTRIQIEPITSYLYGTEYGNFDFSLGANIEGFVPLWRGAELYGSYIAPLYNTRNMNDGRVYSQYRLRGGLNAAALAQSFWLLPQVFNVAAVGRFDYQYLGVQNETTVFVPGRPDLVRLRLAYLHHEPGHDELPSEKNAVLTYRWVQPAWKLWIEAGVARYVGGDKGPLITLTRWFDDVSVSVHGEHSGQGSFVGAAISFPLTPRQGMKPGVTQVYGSEQFALDFRSRVGSTNYLAGNAAENMSFPYSTQQYLLNQGRFSEQYFGTQLYRMRDAYLRYVPSSKDDAKGEQASIRADDPPPAAADTTSLVKLCARNSLNDTQALSTSFSIACQSLTSGENQ